VSSGGDAAVQAATSGGPSEFADLVEQLAELEQQRHAPPGLSAEAAARRARIERRLMDLLCTDASADERRSSIRVPSQLWVQVRRGEEVVRGRLSNVGIGGAFVDIALVAQVGDEVVVAVERQRGQADPGFQVRARVAWLAAADGRTCKGFCVAFTAQNDADETRLRRLVLDVLREHMPSSYG
jgi:Tfp pilus assembly protein PilZ